MEKRTQYRIQSGVFALNVIELVLFSEIILEFKNIAVENKRLT